MDGAAVGGAEEERRGTLLGEQAGLRRGWAGHADGRGGGDSGAGLSCGGGLDFDLATCERVDTRSGLWDVNGMNGGTPRMHI